MSLEKAVMAGLAGNEMSKKITNTDEVSAGRTTVATGAGGAYGAVTAGVISIGATTLGATVTAPVLVPLTIGGAIIGGIASLFD